MSERGYIHCAHKHCFAIIIGNPGDLCDDCREDADTDPCDGCDSDLMIETIDRFDVLPYEGED